MGPLRYRLHGAVRPSVGGVGDLAQSEQMMNDFWNRIYNILVSHAGATEYWRTNFIQVQIKGCREYRFSGNLGFGGKFRVTTNGRMYVDCYPEDETPERSNIIKATNEAIAKLLQSI